MEGVPATSNHSWLVGALDQAWLPSTVGHLLGGVPGPGLSAQAYGLSTSLCCLSPLLGKLRHHGIQYFLYMGCSDWKELVLLIQCHQSLLILKLSAAQQKQNASHICDLKCFSSHIRESRNKEGKLI